MTRRIPELAHNQVFKRGLVTERDGENHRVRVKPMDEDDSSTHWIDVIGRGSTKNASFDMPDVDDEVWYGVDIAGDAGVYLGTRYNSKDRPPSTDPDVSRQNRRDGSFEQHDPASKSRVIDTAGGSFTIIAGGVTVRISPEGVTFSGGTITHNGKKIDDTHVHTDVMAGPANTGPPA